MGQSLTIKKNYVSAPSAPIQHDRDPVAMLFHWAETRPKSTYLRQPFNGVWREYSWAEVADQVRRMAAALQALGLQPGDAVALTGKNTAHWIMADLAVGMADGPAAALALVDALAGDPLLRHYHWLPSVRGDLLAKLDRGAEARAEFERAASLTRNAQEKALLLARACG